MENLRHVSSGTHCSYALAPHVHACLAGNDLVLLDLKRDRYLGLDPRDFEAARHLIEGLPTVDLAPTEHSTVSGASVDSLLNELSHLDMIRTRAPSLKPTRQRPLARPGRALIEGYAAPRTRLRMVDFVQALQSIATARLLIRWRTFEQIVSRVQSRRARNAGKTFDTAEARRHISVFNRIKPLIYTESDQCLFSSLSMHEFLCHKGLFPHFVFGVKTRPFGAHCWLQHDEVVVNDTPERVREFTPIFWV
jgi:hypothetical protein